MDTGVSVCREATNENLEGGIWVVGSGESFSYHTEEIPVSNHWYRQDGKGKWRRRGRDVQGQGWNAAGRVRFARDGAATGRQGFTMRMGGGWNVNFTAFCQASHTESNTHSRKCGRGGSTKQRKRNGGRERWCNCWDRRSKATMVWFVKWDGRSRIAQRRFY